MSGPSPQSRSRVPLLIGIFAALSCLGAVLVIVLVVVAGGVIFASNSEEDPAKSTAASGGSELAVPPGVADDQAYLELSTSSEGPVVDVYIDFLCPHCATFHDTHGEDLTQMALDGEITLRMHPRPMLDASSTPAGYSGRAANAAVCAYAEDPEQWFPAEDALFADHPGAEGLTDDELGTRISEATGLDVTDCIAEGTYIPWIEEVVEAEAQSTAQGTPVVFIDGEQFTGDIAAPGSVAEAIAAG